MANRTRRRPSASRTSVNESRGEKRVAIVTRISTDEINQPYSLEAQTKGLEAFVSSQPGHVITHRFVDQASGATLDRPGLQAALSAAKTGEFDVLLVYRIDRLTRSIVGLMTIVEALDGAGVALRSATEPIDTQGPVGRMLLQLLGIFAEFERGLLIDRITKGFERKAARGEWLGGPGPFGYRVDSASKTLVPDPNEAAMVRKIFVAYADEHLGATGLANHLNGAGLRNRGDRLWSNQTVLHVLRNPVYLGKISHGDDVYEGKHPSIVDDDLFCPGTTAARRASRRGRESSAEHFGLPADGDAAVPRMRRRLLRRGYEGPERLLPLLRMPEPPDQRHLRLSEQASRSGRPGGRCHRRSDPDVVSIRSVRAGCRIGARGGGRHSSPPSSRNW